MEHNEIELYDVLLLNGDLFDRGGNAVRQINLVRDETGRTVVVTLDDKKITIPWHAVARISAEF
jgi:hypothetical protein